MTVYPSSGSGGVGRIPPKQPAVQRESVAADRASFGQTTELEAALARQPDVRPEVVERARQLVGDINWPPDETIQKIASLLAIEPRSEEA